MKYYEYEKRNRNIKQDQLFNEHLSQKILIRIGMTSSKEELILFRSCPDLTKEGMNEFMADMYEEILSEIKDGEQEIISFFDDTDGSITMIRSHDVSYIRMERVIDAG